MSKKYFLVTEEWMKWAFTHGAEYAVTADCPPNYPEELDPAGRWLTREQFRKAAARCAGDGFYQEFDWQELDKVDDELFGPEEKE